MKPHNAATFGSLDDIEEDEEDVNSCGLRNYKLDIDSSADTVFEKDPEIPVLRMKNCSFSWGTEEGRLSINQLSFPRGNIIRRGIIQIPKNIEISIPRSIDCDRRENWQRKDDPVAWNVGGNSENNRNDRVGQVSLILSST